MSLETEILTLKQQKMLFKSIANNNVKVFSVTLVISGNMPSLSISRSKPMEPKTLSIMFWNKPGVNL